jgi:hypothetical protein
MDTKELCEKLKELTKDFPAIIDVSESTNHENVVVLKAQDFRPDQEDRPWNIFASYSEDWHHEVYKVQQSCVEFIVPLAELKTSSESYINEVAQISIPWVDHQRLFPGASLGWNPEKGYVRASARAFDYGQPKEFLDKEIQRCVYNLVGLLYHVMYKQFEVNVLNSLGKMGKSVVAEIEGRMHMLLGVKESEEEGDSID